MKAFRLIGGNTRFALQRSYLSGNCIPAVVGISLVDGKRAIAAESDIVWLDDFRFKPCAAPDELGRFAIYDCQAEDIVARGDGYGEAETMAVLMNIRQLLRVAQEAVI
jgi:hypothetical protein